ncbi:STAS domain-containing protein [Flavivirga aquimarina]|uniref:STAS domain-containing protein n=1 Tax=Flavivirga aquimarina TaxID=2027862 RepID=A0ABT8W7H4_9FLAO|nr:STAS domain-containing protein [Flavivirga aquimarina]MDO5969066.1 STAS domain-containing protein [Flavivirga aquimarina]
MALKITEENGTFLLEGVINATTATNFKNHLESIFNEHETLTIDIENVTKIDVKGMQTIRALYSNALTLNKPFYIIGTGCKEIYDDFALINAA